MPSKLIKGLAALAAGAVVFAAATHRSDVTAAAPGAGAVMQSIGPLAFAPDGTLFAADNKAATIYALNLGAQASGAKAGAADVSGVDQKIAALLGTDAASIQVTDLAVHPKTHNAYISVMRGAGADSKPALLRV